MIVQQIYTNCLAEASYFVASNGEAAIIDPIRDIEQYLELAEEHQCTIKYIIETHFHADFVSGHVELAEKTGAKIVFGPNAVTNYPSHVAEHGEILPLGKVQLKVLHTPGHTLESSSFLLIDENGKNHAIFTGDTLFIGDVGRPDLAVKSNLTERDLAGMLYDSLHQIIKPLEDDVIVYPAHGAGSACGKNISKETFSTLLEQKKNNYALQEMEKEDFISILTHGILPAPEYFGIAAGINKGGYDSVDKILQRAQKTLSVEEVKQAIENGATVLDTRHPDTFVQGFIPSSINIGLNGQFAIWAGTILDYSKPLVLIVDEGKEEEAMRRLIRVGIENILGVVNGGFIAWKNANLPIETIPSVSPNEVPMLLEKNIQLLDVRKPGEVANGKVKNASEIHLQILEENTNELQKDTTYAIYCAGGYRSVIAASILKKNGFNNIINIQKGWGGIKEVTELEKTGAGCSNA